eukprot:2752797-Prymnesium_polylepis.1
MRPRGLTYSSVFYCQSQAFGNYHSGEGTRTRAHQPNSGGSTPTQRARADVACIQCATAPRLALRLSPCDWWQLRAQAGQLEF